MMWLQVVKCSSRFQYCKNSGISHIIATLSSVLVL